MTTHLPYTITYKNYLEKYKKHEVKTTLFYILNTNVHI